jgi:hypothetical protein
MDEIPLPDKGKVQVQYDIGNDSIKFHRSLDQFPPYSTVTEIVYYLIFG